MKRASLKSQLQTLPQASTSPTRVCTRPDCGKALTATQKKYCSHSCRNTVLSPGNSGGAPGKYLPEYATSKLEEYLAFCEKGNEPTLIPTESSYIVMQNARMPSLIGYARFLDFPRQTLEHWVAQHSDFARGLDLLKDVQQEYLINNGLSGKYNAQLAKLMLGTNHGIVERKEVDSTHKLLGIVKHVYQEADRMERERYPQLTDQ
ncbi:MAG TPA: terminase small subunit [Candidatus Paceibacterota bacterium]